MRRRIRDRRQARAEAEAAGIPAAACPPRPAETRPGPKTLPRLRVVWAVCDASGRSVASYPYPDKAQAEALAARLQTQGQGDHFLRAVKVPIEPGDG